MSFSQKALIKRSFPYDNMGKLPNDNNAFVRERRWNEHLLNIPFKPLLGWALQTLHLIPFFQQPCKASDHLFLFTDKKVLEGQDSRSSSFDTWPVVGLCNAVIEWMNNWMRRLSLRDVVQGHSACRHPKPHLNPGLSVSKADRFRPHHFELNQKLLYVHLRV